jgi:PTH1 family peptidyl-tRNA hydrolase
MYMPLSLFSLIVIFSSSSSSSLSGWRGKIRAMKLVVGLGNPGEKYIKTRHNTGFLVLDELKSKISNLQLSITNQLPIFKFQKKFNSEICIFQLHTTNNLQLVLARPQTFMNDSGKAVSALAAFYKILPSDIWVIHDDLDIKLGDYKIQKGTGPKVHNGIKSIEKELGTKDFWRVRVGIENRQEKFSIFNYQLSIKSQLSNIQNLKKEKTPGDQYVLQDFTDEEAEILEPVITKIVYDINSRFV